MIFHSWIEFGCILWLCQMCLQKITICQQISHRFLSIFLSCTMAKTLCWSFIKYLHKFITTINVLTINYLRANEYPKALVDHLSFVVMFMTDLKCLTFVFELFFLAFVSFCSMFCASFAVILDSLLLFNLSQISNGFVYLSKECVCVCVCAVSSFAVWVNIWFWCCDPPLSHAGINAIQIWIGFLNMCLTGMWLWTNRLDRFSTHPTNKTNNNKFHLF